VQREKKKPVIGKRFMSGSLEKMIMTYAMKPAGKEETEKGAAPTLPHYAAVSSSYMFLQFCAIFCVYVELYVL